MARTKKAEPPKLTLGELSDQLWEAREKKRELAAQAKIIETEIDGITSILLERMEAEKLESVKGSVASLTVTPSTQPNIEDWEAVCAFIKKTGNWQLIRRQLNPEPWRELMTGKTGVPGTVAFVKKTINMRTNSK